MNNDFGPLFDQSQPISRPAGGLEVGSCGACCNLLQRVASISRLFRIMISWSAAGRFHQH